MPTLFVPLEAKELVPGRRVLVAPDKKLSACLQRAKLLQKARDEGSLKTLITLFASQPATVIEVRASIDVFSLASNHDLRITL